MAQSFQIGAPLHVLGDIPLNVVGLLDTGCSISMTLPMALLQRAFPTRKLSFDTLPEGLPGLQYARGTTIQSAGHGATSHMRLVKLHVSLGNQRPILVTCGIEQGGEYPVIGYPIMRKYGLQIEVENDEIVCADGERIHELPLAGQKIGSIGPATREYTKAEKAAAVATEYVEPEWLVEFKVTIRGDTSEVLWPALLDTGAFLSIIDFPHIKKAYPLRHLNWDTLPSGLPPDRLPTRLKSTIQGAAAGGIVVLKTCKIDISVGDLADLGVDVGVYKPGSPGKHSLILGYDLIRKFISRIDLAHERVILKDGSLIPLASPSDHKETYQSFVVWERWQSGRMRVTEPEEAPEKDPSAYISLPLPDAVSTKHLPRKATLYINRAGITSNGISIEEYEGILGQGIFAVVYKGRWNGQPAAIRIQSIDHYLTAGGMNSSPLKRDDSSLEAKGFEEGALLASREKFGPTLYDVLRIPGEIVVDGEGKAETRLSVVALELMGGTAQMIPPEEEPIEAYEVPQLLDIMGKMRTAIIRATKGEDDVPADLGTQNLLFAWRGQKRIWRYTDIDMEKRLMSAEGLSDADLVAKSLGKVLGAQFSSLLGRRASAPATTPVPPSPEDVVMSAPDLMTFDGSTPGVPKKKRGGGGRKKKSPVREKKRRTEAERKAHLRRASRHKDFSRYIYRMFKGLRPSKELHIGSKSIAILNSMAIDIMEKLAVKAAQFARLSAGITMSARDVRAAARIILSPSGMNETLHITNPNSELLKHALHFADQSLTKFAANKPGVKGAKVSFSKRAELFMPVGRVLRYLHAAEYTERTSISAAVYTAAIFEYIIMEVNEGAITACVGLKKKTLSARHIMLSIRGDSELDAFFGQSATFSQGGNPVYIHPVLLHKRKDLKKAKEAR